MRVGDGGIVGVHMQKMHLETVLFKKLLIRV